MLPTAAVVIVLAVVGPASVPLLDGTVWAQSAPSLSIEFSPRNAVPANTEITAAITLSNLDAGSHDSVVLRADVTEGGNARDVCEGDGTGENVVVEVDGSDEVVTATVSDSCPLGGPYVFEARILTDGTPPIELASASARFVVSAYLSPDTVIGPPPDPGALLWLDPDPRTLTMSVHGEWQRIYVRSDVLLSGHDHAFVYLNDLTDLVHWAFVNRPDTLSHPPEESPEDACARFRSRQEAYGWWIHATQRAVDQSFWLVACGLGNTGTGAANIGVWDVDPPHDNYEYEFTVLAEGAQPPPVLSSDATLSSLSLSGVPFSFDPATGGYALSVDHGTDRTTVAATTNHAASDHAVYRNGTIDTDGTIDLAVGTTTIMIIVTAEDGTTNAYTLTITRAQPPPVLSSDATLSSLSLSGVPFSFDPATGGYALSVDHGTDRTTVAATTNHAASDHAVYRNGTIDTDGTIDLAVGTTTIMIIVTAEDGTTNAYTLTITRAQPPPVLSSDATLSSLSLSGVPYAVYVAHDVDSFTIAATTNHDAAGHTIYRNGIIDPDGTIDVLVGVNVVSIVVTAEDGTINTYTLTITRAPQLPLPLPPTVDVSLDNEITLGTEATVTMSFANITAGNAVGTFRADVVGFDTCEGDGISSTRQMAVVDEDPEIRTGTISAACPVGTYTVVVTLTSNQDVLLAAGSTTFSVVAPT